MAGLRRALEGLGWRLRALLGRKAGEPARTVARVVESGSIEQLIERSSLGDPEAVKLRASVPADVVDRVLKRADELGPLELDVVVAPPSLPPRGGLPFHGEVAQRSVEVPRPTPPKLHAVPRVPRPDRSQKKS